MITNPLPSGQLINVIDQGEQFHDRLARTPKLSSNHMLDKLINQRAHSI